MVSPTAGWATTATSVLRTTDGGRSWSAVTPRGLGRGVKGVFASASTALVAASSGGSVAAFHTIDGGKAWGQAVIPPPASLAGHPGPIALAALGRDGWLLMGGGVGAGQEPVALFATSSGGATWTQVAASDVAASGLPLGGIKGGLTFGDASAGWLAGSDYTTGRVWLFRTGDGGRHWAAQRVPPPKGGATAQLGTWAPVFFGTKGLLPVSGAAHGRTTVAIEASSNGGATWAPSPLPTLHIPAGSGGPVVVDFADPTHAWVYGGDDLWVTTNGRSWTAPRPEPGLAGLSELDFISATHGWAIVSGARGGTLLQTTDGGRTWAPA